MTDDARSAGDQLRNLGDDVRALIRQEVRQGQAEMMDKAREAAKGSALLGAAGLFGLAAAGMSAVVLVRVLDRFMPPPAAAATAAAGLGGAAAGLAAWGLAELRPVRPLLPERTLTSLRQDVEAASGRHHG